MWNQLVRRSPSKANRLRARQTTVAVASRAKEASMAGRSKLSKRALLLANGVVLLAALGLWVSAASSQNQAPRKTKAFHATKDCSGMTGLVGAYCTIRTSNVKAIEPGSKIFYFQEASRTALDSDIVVYVKRGTVATGHCFLSSASAKGLCTISNGTGALAGFHLRVRVTADASIPKLWHWDGTYSFGKG
jgi:hypothetical protein